MINITQRKVCGNCRAFSPVNNDCTLGYDTRWGKQAMGVIVEVHPIEPCPKPLTIADYIESSKNYRK